MTNIQLIATDMDGTLLNDGRSVSKENILAIKEAQKAGIHVVVATGRDYTEAAYPLKEAGLRLPLICVNGADLRKEDGEIIHQQTLSMEQFNIMDRILKEESIYFEIYTSKGAYTNDDKQGLDLVIDLLLTTGEFNSYDEAMQLAEKRFQEGSVNRTNDYKRLLEYPQYDLFKLLAFSKDETRRERAKKRIENELDVSISASAKDNLEITHNLATKGKGIEIIAKEYGTVLAQTMAIGDNYNDVSMMKKAGLSVAMGNAETEIKNMCDIITKPNSEDGVADAIRSVISKVHRSV
ncbi:Cof-type HAD-IIB family hydrolase [Salipaludibacillus daqingensis]|uniref:Cof-type HAD-IIB family hydrolase n=1 Tax=Salipaludibacillus daqingensis TaxID=3041001 RepID=UPI002473BF14|nr:Cof-type HAD-IIB family hydrolase [Salipaludibacillus daqingensis]